MPDDTDIATTEFIPATTLSVGTPSVVSRVIQMNRRGASNVSLHTIFNEDGATAKDLVATVLVEVSNDPRARPGSGAEAAAKWIDVTTFPGVTVGNVSAGEGSVLDIFSAMTVAYMRQTITRTAGVDGDVRSNIAGHD